MVCKSEDMIYNKNIMKIEKGDVEDENISNWRSWIHCQPYQSGIIKCRI
jgi:hypothetical protein